ncbi:MAG: nucleotide disphospho-sugar-binding domain-containing protein [Deltaproteobacteria bacterium]
MGGSRRKVVLAGIGTKGDLFPLLGLGRELCRRGYVCDLLSNQGYAALAQDHGLGFRAVTVAQVNNLVSGRDNLENHVLPSYLPTFEYFAEQLQRGQRLAVVNIDGCSASNHMCERYGLPVCRITLAPSSFRSVHRPTWPLSKKMRGPLANTYRLYRLPQIYARMEASPFGLEHINALRARVGLGALTRFSDVNAPIQYRVGFFPSWYATPQLDWPSPLDLVGFPLPESPAELDPALQDFIAREGKPLVFTPGTGVVDVAGFFEDARLCCERLERPGVFLSPHYRVSETALGRRIFHAPFVELAPLLRRSALLIHHGGIGTVARALEAGVPQIICARAYDQPDNGERVTELGVGAFFEPGERDVERLAREASRLLQSREVCANLATWRAEIARSNALGAAADGVELMLEQRRVALGE